MRKINQIHLKIKQMTVLVDKYTRIVTECPFQMLRKVKLENDKLQSYARRQSIIIKLLKPMIQSSKSQRKRGTI